MICSLRKGEGGRGNDKREDKESLERNAMFILKENEKSGFRMKIRKEGLSGKKNVLKSYKNLKELSLCHKLEFSNPYNFAKYWRKPLVFQTLII